jgi:ATP-dependent protease HslVU (ClpYQ) peptidase subunit
VPLTVCLGYRIPGEGAILACDGRVTDSGSFAILSDAEKKYALCGSVTVLMAGTMGKMWMQLQTNPPKSYKALRAAIDSHGDADTEWLAYDKRADRLFVGDVMSSRNIAGIGAGSSFGLGALEALPLAKTLTEAHKAVSTAIAIACRRNASCGGRIRILTVPRKGAVKFGGT